MIPASRVARRLALALAYIAWLALASLVLFLLVEGFASVWLFAQALGEKSNRPLMERVHTQHDPRIGWINVPNLHVETMYGRHTSLHTNSRSFRNREEFEAAVPEGRIRVLCSGDSFTLGYGVSNEEAFCLQLQALDSRIEAGNLGQGGYGLDQSYLWYLEAGIPLEHQIHVVSFITADFERMRQPRFQGYPKPVLRVEDGALVVHGVPVPRTPFLWPWWTQNKHRFAELNSVRWLGGLYESVRPQGPGSLELPPEELPELVMAVFDRLHALARERDVTLLLVYLPSVFDHPKKQAEWQALLSGGLAERNIPFLDLNGPVRALAKPEQDSLLRGNLGHYTKKGNTFTAQRILQKIRTLRAVPQEEADAPAAHAPAPGEPPWRGAYFTGQDLSGPAEIRWDEAVDFAWGLQPPLPGLPRDDFSVRWDTCLTLAERETLAFLLESDDGSRLYVDGALRGGAWQVHYKNVSEIAVELDPGPHRLTVEYFDARFGASVRLRARSDAGEPVALPRDRLRPPELDAQGHLRCDDTEPAGQKTPQAAEDRAR